MHSAYTTLLCLCLSVLSLAGASFCFRVLRGLNDVVFVENPPEFLRYSCNVRNDTVNNCCFLLCLFCNSLWFWWGPVLVTTCFMCFLDIFLVPSLPICHCGYILSPKFGVLISLPACAPLGDYNQRVIFDLCESFLYTSLLRLLSCSVCTT